MHSLTDVAVFAQGPCQEKFGGVYSAIDIFFNIADCLGLSRPSGGDSAGGYGGHDGGNWDHYGGQEKYKYHHYDSQKPRYAGKGGPEKRHIKRGEQPAKPKKYH